MIARISNAPKFAPVARYLVGDRDGTAPGRVAWTASRNLVTDDPTLAADLMQATADQNLRTTDPVYQLTLSFAPQDHPTPELMRQVADRALSELGLVDHQAILVAHHDREHSHVHVVVNRVHPVTLAAWDRWHDQLTIQRVLFEQERVLGLREVTGRPDRIDDRTADSHDRPKSSRNREAERPIVERVREHIADIRSATSWDELRERLAEHNLRVERRAKGLVITDGTSFARASAVAADVSFSRLETRFGPFPSERECAIPHANERPLTAFDLASEADAATRHLRQIEWAAERAGRSAADLERALAGVYVDPSNARRAIEHTAAERGVDRAMRALRDSPEVYGTLQLTERRHGFNLWRAADDRLVRTAARQATPLVREAAERALQLRSSLSLQPGASRNAVSHAFEQVRATTHDVVTRIHAALAAIEKTRQPVRLALDVARSLTLGRDPAP
jgi:hypothetical protein